MQTLQLLDGPGGRAAFLRCALAHLEPGGLLAAALADATDSFDDEHPLPPPPDERTILGVRYASQLRSVVDEGARAAIHRRREIIGDGRHESTDVVVRLDRVDADAGRARSPRRSASASSRTATSPRPTPTSARPSSSSARRVAGLKCCYSPTQAQRPLETTSNRARSPRAATATARSPAAPRPTARSGTTRPKPARPRRPCSPGRTR